MSRHALLIGVSEFADERLARLNAPTNDVIALRGILRDTFRGNFDSVELSLNEDFLAVRDRLSSLFPRPLSRRCFAALLFGPRNSRPGQSAVFSYQRLQPGYAAHPQCVGPGNSRLH